jgi:hypothetical protein
MKTNKNIGIDWSMGKSNIDKQTGIRYGVISQHNVMPEALDDIEYDYGKPEVAICPECDKEFTVTDKKYGDIIVCPNLNCNESFEIELPDMSEPIGWSYEEEGYQLIDCLDNDIMVLKSPYYTYAQYCSPCVPGAINLDTPMDEGIKGYCLGHDWFEEGKAPYKVYDVKTNKEIKPIE